MDGFDMPDELPDHLVPPSKKKALMAAAAAATGPPSPGNGHVVSDDPY